MYFYNYKYISRFSFANYYVNLCSRKHKFAGIASNAALVSAIQQSFANQTQAIQAVAVRIEPQGKAFHFPFQYLSAPVKEQGMAFRFYSFDPMRHRSSKKLQCGYNKVRRFVCVHLIKRHRSSEQLPSGYNRVRRFVFIHLIPRHRSSEECGT